MKYSVLVALLATVEARHHHHHELVATPDESRAAWQSTRDASRAAAAAQEKFQLEHNQMVAKNYADDVLATNTKKWHDAASQINMKNGGTTPFKTVTNAKLDTMYAQKSQPDDDFTHCDSTGTRRCVAVAQQPDDDFTHCDSTGTRRCVAVAQQTQPDDDFVHCDSTGNRRCVATSLSQLNDPLGHSDASFIPAKAAATATVDAQKSFEATKTADVASRNAANTAEANALKEKVRAARNIQQAGDQDHNPYPAVPGYYKNLYIPSEEMYLSLETPVESYAAKAESLAEVRQTVKTQLETMDAWQAQHAAAMAQWKADSKYTWDMNHHEIKNTYEFD